MAMGDLCVGTCGTLGANGVVTISPTGNSTYQYISTAGGVNGAGEVPSVGGTDGSSFTTSQFSANAGDALQFYFNFVTSDGSGFADYAWAALLDSSSAPVAYLFTARTEPSGTIAPGVGLPANAATLAPPSVPIIPGGPDWSPLGSYSGACFAAGCGYTDWVGSSYTIATAGNYELEFGVTNWLDTIFDTGLAFDGATIAGTSITGAVPEPSALVLFGTVLVALLLVRRRRGSPSMPHL
jgi:hypothetical protein